MTAANFPACLAATLKFEGDYSNDPGDHGGATMWGITHLEYDAWRKSQGQEPRDVREMDEAERDAIYRRNYWDVICGDDLPAGVDFVVWDAGVNSGNSRGIKWLQAALGLPLSGKIDPAAVAEALKSRDNARVIDAAVTARETFLRQIGHGSQAKFLRGWLSRCAQVRQIATKMCADLTPGAEVRATLAAGSSGDEVRELQTRFKTLGYPVGLVDGQFGDATRRAVLLFQEHEKLDGELGEWSPAYWSVLEAAKPITAPERANATAADVAAVNRHASLLLTAQRVLAAGLAFLGIGGGAATLPDTLTAFSTIRDMANSVWALAGGHAWLLAVIGIGTALAFVRVLLASHVLAFQSGEVQ
jgi:lysozyme family protein